MPTRTVTIQVRSTGARRAAREVDTATKSVRGLGAATAATGVGLGRLHDRTSTVVRGLSGLSTLAKRTTFAVGAIGAFAAKTGIEFNSMLEQQTVAFTGLLGSTAKAKTFVNELFEIAAKTPFESEDVIRGVQLLTAYGLSANEAKLTFLDLGNAVAASGRGSEAIQRSTLALGQIASAGVVHQEDLNQLLEAGTISTQKLAKSYGMSGEEFRAAIAGSEITATSFFKKTRELWQKDPLYKGAAAKQAKTFQGQLSTLVDYTKRTLGTITEPLFKALERDALPRLTRFTRRLDTIFKKNLSISDKLDLSGEALQRELGPLVNQFERFWKESKLGDRIANGIATALIQGAGKSAATAAKAFINAFIDAPVWLQIAGGGWFAKKIGVFGTKGKGGGLLGKPGLGTTAANPMWVRVVGGGAGGGGGGGTTILPTGPLGKLGKFKNLARLGVRALGWVAVVDFASSVLTGKSIFDKDNPVTKTAFGWAKAPRNPNLSPHGPTRARGPQQHGPAIDFDRPPKFFGLDEIVPGGFKPAQGLVTVPINVQVDGQTLARIVAQAAVRRQSTK